MTDVVQFRDFRRPGETSPMRRWSVEALRQAVCSADNSDLQRQATEELRRREAMGGGVIPMVPRT